MQKQLARFVTGEHDPECSGCPACSPNMAVILDRANMRHAAEPPCSYAAGLAALRRAMPATYRGVYPAAPVDPAVQNLGIPALLQRIPLIAPRTDVPDAPDGYAIAIQRLKENRR